MKDSNFIRLLKRSMNENIMVAVYSNKNRPDTCSVGYVDSITKDMVLIKHVTPHGLTDGFVIRRLEDVFRIDINGQYENKLQRLYFLQEQSHHAITSQLNSEVDLFVGILNISQKFGKVVDVCIDDTESQADIVGFVKEVKENEVIISQISEYGFANGESSLMIDDIVKISCDTYNGHILELLFLDNDKRSC